MHKVVLTKYKKDGKNEVKNTHDITMIEVSYKMHDIGVLLKSSDQIRKFFL